MKRNKARALSLATFEARERVYHRRRMILHFIRHSFECTVPAIPEMTRYMKYTHRYTKTSISRSMIRSDYKALRLLRRSSRSR